MIPADSRHLTTTAQQYLEIADITNDLLILKDGSTALVLQVSAINFGLLSEPEQDAIIYAYAALINSLSFPIQIVIRSQPKDVTSYLHYVEEQLQRAGTDIRRRQIASYHDFVANLITEQNVLDKQFFVVLPMTALELGIPGAINPLPIQLPRRQTAAPSFDKSYVVEKSLNNLLPRRDHMISQFGRLGLAARHLQTKELIQLFYVAYNGQSAVGAQVVDSREYTSALIGPEQTADTTPAATTVPVAPAAAPSAPTLAPAATGPSPTLESVTDGTLPSSISPAALSAIPHETVSTQSTGAPR